MCAVIPAICIHPDQLFHKQKEKGRKDSKGKQSEDIQTQKFYFVFRQGYADY
jgi:hypothetical protein